MRADVKRRRWRGRLGLLAIVCAASPVAAQPPLSRFVDPQRGQDLETLVAQGRSGAPDVAASDAAVDAAAAMARQARLRANPMAGVTRREEVGGMGVVTELEMAWPLELWRRGPRVAVADAEAGAAANRHNDRLRLKGDAIRRAYGDLAAAARDLRVTQDLLVSERQLFTLADARAREGTAPRLERDLADLEVRRLESQQHLAEGRAEAALVRLKATVGLPPEADLSIRHDLEATVAALAPVPAGEPVRPDLAAADDAVALATARVAEARAAGRIDLSLRGGYMRMISGFPQLGVGAGGVLEPIRGRFHTLVVGATVDLPLLNRAQGSQAAAEAEARGARAARDALALDVQSEMAASVALAAHARAGLDVYATRVRPTARRTLDVLRQAYELGSRNLMDVVAESRRYQEVERGYTEALRAVFDAEVAVRTARGGQ